MAKRKCQTCGDLFMLRDIPSKDQRSRCPECTGASGSQTFREQGADIHLKRDPGVRLWMYFNEMV